MKTNKQNLYEQYLESINQIFDAWFRVQILYSKLADSYNALCQKFFEPPVLKQFGHTIRYCIMKQYKLIKSDVFVALNQGFPAGQEFLEPAFSDKKFCEYYTPDKMCIVNGCDYHPFNKQYFTLLQDFQNALDKYKQVVAYRDELFNKMLAVNGRDRDKQKAM